MQIVSCRIWSSISLILFSPLHTNTFVRFPVNYSVLPCFCCSGYGGHNDGHYPGFLAHTKDILPRSPLDINQVSSVLIIWPTSLVCFQVSRTYKTDLEPRPGRNRSVSTVLHIEINNNTDNYQYPFRHRRRDTAFAYH